MTNDETLTYIDGQVGRMRLNRPSAINALTLGMVRPMTAALLEWQSDPKVKAVMIDHAAGRGFCAGGDVVTIANSAQGHGAAGDAFFYQEYQMNHLMYTYGKPGVVFMDGVTMGGGVGITCPCKYRIATERTMFAMPETGIGLFPDVGGGRYLSRLTGRVAQYLALTGARLDGAECFALRLASHYIPSEALEEVKAAICANPEKMTDILGAASVAPPPAKIFDVLHHINRHFAADTLEGVIASLESDDGEWAQKQLKVLRTKSPLSCKIALRHLTESLKITDFADQMKMEFGIVSRIFRAHDFYEGVRALLIDKDGAPQWEPPTPEGVTDAMVDAYFQPMPAKRAWQPIAFDGA